MHANQKKKDFKKPYMPLVASVGDGMVPEGRLCVEDSAASGWRQSPFLAAWAAGLLFYQKGWWHLREVSCGLRSVWISDCVTHRYLILWVNEYLDWLQLQGEIWD